MDKNMAMIWNTSKNMIYNACLSDDIPCTSMIYSHNARKPIGIQYREISVAAASYTYIAEENMEKRIIAEDLTKRQISQSITHFRSATDAVQSIADLL